MKKFLGFFVKRKQKQGNAYDVYFDDNVDNVPQTNGYKRYQFDCDSPNNEVSGASFDTKLKDSSSHCFSGSSQTFTSTLTDLFNTDDLESVINKASVSNPSTGSGSSFEEVSAPVKQEQSNPQLGVKKSGKNMYVITISNSKYFHIGSQKTINIGEKALPGVQVQVEAQPCIGGSSSGFEANLNKLLDCDDKLTEEYITLISLHADDKYREFLRNLGLEETFLDILQRRCDNDRTLTLYDGLQEYITLFPNTSLGFVINALNNTKQKALIEKLAQEVKT